MIGIFDSGYGGLPTMRAVTKRLPDFDVVYLGDHARAPYGPLSTEEIYTFAFQGVEYLFAQGCELIIFACNTAAANALRRIQQEILPKKYSDKKVLGILVPTVEQLTGSLFFSTIGILATEATVKSGAYTREIQNRRPDIYVLEQACPELSPLIEAGASEVIMRETVKKYVKELFGQQNKLDPPIDAVLLGCTHYELIMKIISQELPNDVKLLGQSAIVAESFVDYLERHSEIKIRLSKDGLHQFLTTGNAEEVSLLGSRFFGETVVFNQVNIST